MKITPILVVNLVIFVSLGALAAPLMIGRGAGGVVTFTGGSTTGQWLNVNGSAGAPAYGYSGDTDIGFYRANPNIICHATSSDTDSLVCIDNGQIQINATSTQQIGISSGTTTSINPFFAWINTIRVAGWAAFGTNSSIFGGKSYSGSPRAAFVEGLTETVVIGARNNANDWQFSGYQDATMTTTASFGSNVGSQAWKLSVGTNKILTIGAATYGLRVNTADELEYVSGGTTVGYSRNLDALEATDTNYGFFSPDHTGTPAGTDCDAAGEHGRIKKTSEDDLYICNFSGGRGWDKITLTE